MAVPIVSTLSRIVPPLVLALGLGAAAPACESEPDRPPDRAPVEPRVLHDAQQPDVPQETPSFTHGVRGTPGMTVDPPAGDAGAAAGTGAAAAPRDAGPQAPAPGAGQPR